MNSEDRFVIKFFTIAIIITVVISVFLLGIVLL